MSDQVRPRTRRKLNRRQVQEILERNVRLYRDEHSFIPYLIELAVYLLEYEYDWTESGAKPPPGLRAGLELDNVEAEAAAALATPPERVPTPVPVTAEKAPNPPESSYDGANVKVFRNQTPKPRRPGSVMCPHCGEPIDSESYCPNCRQILG